MVTKPPVVETSPLMAWSKPPMSRVPGARTLSEPLVVAAPTLVPTLLPTMVTTSLPAPVGSALAMPSWRVPALIVVAPEYACAALMICVPEPVLVNAKVPEPSERVPEKLLRPVEFTPAAADAGVYGERPALLLPPTVRVEVPLAWMVPSPARPSIVSLLPARSKIPVDLTRRLLVSEI